MIYKSIWIYTLDTSIIQIIPYHNKITFFRCCLCAVPIACAALSCNRVSIAKWKNHKAANRYRDACRSHFITGEHVSMVHVSAESRNPSGDVFIHFSAMCVILPIQSWVCSEGCGCIFILPKWRPEWKKTAALVVSENRAGRWACLFRLND